MMQNIKVEWIPTKSKDVKWLEVDKSKPYVPFTITSLKTPAQPAVGL